MTSLDKLSLEELQTLKRAKMAASQPPIERAAGRTARSLASGVGQVGDLAKVISDPFIDAAGYLTQELGAPETGAMIKRYGSAAPYPSDTMRKSFDEATDGRYAPATDAERYADAAAEFVSGAGVTGLLAKGAQAARPLGRSVQQFLDDGGVAGLFGAAGAGAGAEIAKDSEVNPLIGSLVGGIGGGVGAKAASSTADAISRSRIIKDESGALHIPFRGERFEGGSNTDVPPPRKLSKAERFVARTLINEEGLTRIQAAQQVRKAGTGVVPLTLPERTESRSLLRYQQRLTENPTQAGKVLGDFNEERFRNTLPKAFDQFVTDMTGTRSSPVAAGKKVGSAARGVISKATAKRARRAEPFYRLASMQMLNEAEMQSMRASSPLFDGLLKKVMDDPVYRADLGDAAPNSVAAIDYTKKALDDLIDSAKRSGDNNKARILTAEKQKIIDAIDAVSPAYAMARKVFAENSPRINKLNENIVGILADVTQGNPEKALSTLSKESPASIRYARRVIGGASPESWQALVGAHMREVAEKGNYSPTKILNALSNKSSGGSVIRENKLNAMLTPKQRRAKDLMFTYLRKAQQVKYGSPTATNQQTDLIMEAALSEGSQVARQTGGAVETIARGDRLGMLQAAATNLYDWYESGIRGKNYEELANVFVGRGAEDFAERLAKIHPDDLAGAQAIILDRARSVAASGGKGGFVGGRQGAVAESQEGKNAAQKTVIKPSINLDDMSLDQLYEIKRRRESSAPRGDSGNDQLSDSFIKQNEGLRLSAYQDTKGNPTIGYGFNFNSGIAPQVWKRAGVAANYNKAKRGEVAITPQEAEALYVASYQVAADDARSYYNRFDRMPRSQQMALVDLSYHHGLPSLKRAFPGLPKALANNDKNQIARIIRNSSYAEKFPDRARKNLNLLLQEFNYGF